MKRVLWPAMIAGSFCATGSAFAATTTTTMGVSMVVQSSCTVSATALSFGSHTIIDMSGVINEDAPATITVTCTLGEDYSVALDAGGGAGATVAVRKMTNGASTLNYILYSDAGRTTVWGDGTASTSTVSGTGTGDAQELDVWGEVPQQTNLRTGTYNDTVTVTVTY